MTDQPQTGPSRPELGFEITDFGRARQHLARAIEATARDLEIPATTVTDRAGRKVPEPMPALHLADEMAAAARFLQRHDYIPLARAQGHSWREIGEALRLVKVGYASVAEAAYDFATEQGNWHRDGGGWPVRWACPACEQMIVDKGTYNGVRDDEENHREDCTRHAADIEAEDAAEGGTR